MNDCLFCKIIAGEIPAEKVYEDDRVLAILDIKPVNPGHVLVLPKEHFEGFLDTPPEMIAEMSKAAKKIIAAMKTSLSAEGFNITFNTGQAAGQVIFHTHMHVMPRFSGDGYELWHGKDYDPGEMEATAEKMRTEINRN
jgi:histidine triad (HIT) family protein